MHLHYAVSIAIDGLRYITLIASSEVQQLAIRKAYLLPILSLRGEMEEESLFGPGGMADCAFEVLKVELSLG